MVQSRLDRLNALMAGQPAEAQGFSPEPQSQQQPSASSMSRMARLDALTAGQTPEVAESAGSQALADYSFWNQTPVVPPSLPEVPQIAGESTVGLPETVRPAPRTVGQEVADFNILDALAMLPFSPTQDWEKKGYATAKERLALGEYGQRHAMTPMGGYATVQMPATSEQLRGVVSEYEQKQQQGATVPAQIFKGATQLPAYMGEFAAGGAAGKAVGLAQKGIKGAVAAAGMRTLLQPQRVSSAIIDQQEKGEQPATALLKAYGDVYIENLSEAAGGAVAPALRKLPFGGKLLDAMAGLARKTGIPENEFIQRISTKAGWNGLAAEWGEERLGTILRAVADVDDFGAGKDSNPLERLAAGLTQDLQVQNQLVELGVLSIPALGKRAASAFVSREAKDEQIVLVTPEQRPAEAPPEPTTPTEVPKAAAVAAPEAGKEITRGPEKPAVPAKVPAAGVAVRPPTPEGAAQVERTIPEAPPKPAEEIVAPQAGEVAKQPWELTQAEWDARSEQLKSDTGEYRSRRFAVSEQGGKAWQAEYDFLNSGRRRRWMRYRGGEQEPYISFEQPKPGEQDFEDARELKPQHKYVVEDAVARGETVPARVLEEYKSEPWAQAVIAKLSQSVTGQGEIEPSIGAASANFPSQNRAIGRAQKLSTKSGKPTYVVQRENGSYATYPKPPKTGEYTLVDMSRPADEQVTFIKAASTTMEEAFDYGEHPKESQKHLSELARFKTRLAEKTADADSIADELWHYVRTNVPREQQWRFVSLLQKVGPNRPAKTNVRDLMSAIARTEQTLRGEEHRSALKELKETWSDVQSKYRRGREPLGKLDDAARQRIDDLMGTVGVKGLSPGKKVELEALSKAVQQLSTELGNAASAMNTELASEMLHVPKARIEELARLGKTDVREMTADDIRQITDTLRYIVGQWEVAHSEQHQRRVARIGKGIEDATANIAPKTRAIGEVTQRLPVVKFVGKIGQARIDTLIKFAMGKDHTAAMGLLMDSLEQAQENTYGKFFEMADYAAERMKAIGFGQKETDGLEETVQVTLGGKVIDLPIRQLTALYAHSQSEENLREILRSKGLIVQVSGRTGIKTYYTDEVTAKEIVDATEKLPDIYKRLVTDVMFDMNEKKAAPAINEASLRLEGSEKARIENYVHLAREAPPRIGGGAIELSEPPEDRGRAQPRTGGLRRIYLQAIDQEIVEQMQFAAEYYGMTEALQDARTLLMDERFKEQMEKTGNGEYYRSIKTMFERAQGTFAERNALERAMSRGLSRYGQSVLSLRISGGLVQLTSPPTAWGVVDPKYFAGITPPTPKLIADLKAKYPTLRNRWELGGFHFVIGDIASRSTFQRVLLGKTEITEKPIQHYTWGDEAALGTIYLACERKVAAETPHKRGTPEFDAAVANLFRQALRTQGQYDMLHRSQLTSEPSPWWKGSTMFMSSTNAFLNTLMQAVDDARKGRISAGKAAETIGGVGLSLSAATVVRRAFKLGLMTGLIALLVSMDDKDEKELRRNKALRAQVDKELKNLPQRVAYEALGLWALGQAFASIGQRVADRIRGKPRSEEPSQIETGNVFTDLVLEGQQLADDAGQLVADVSSGKTYESGRNKGKPKWKVSAVKLADQMLNLVAYATGAPYGGIKSDIVWPAQSASRTLAATPTRIELMEKLANITYEDDYRGPEIARWLPHKDREDEAAKIKAELSTITDEEFKAWRKHHAEFRREESRKRYQALRENQQRKRNLRAVLSP